MVFLEGGFNTRDTEGAQRTRRGLMDDRKVGGGGGVNTKDSEGAQRTRKGLMMIEKLEGGFNTKDTEVSIY